MSNKMRELERLYASMFLKGIENGSTIRYICKYRTVEQTLQFLDNMQLYFALAKEFNDPFECRANIDVYNSQDEWANYLRGQGVAYVKADQLAYDIAHDPLKAENVIKKAIDDVLQTTGFFCGSVKDDDILMWSHYAKDHKGICLKFDMKEDLEFFYFPKKVEYHPELLKYNYLRDNNGPINSIFRKYDTWAYEEEYRIAKQGFHGLRKVKPSALSEIIFGCKIDPKDKVDIIQKVKSKGYNHIRFKLASMSSSQYKLLIR